MKKRIGITVLTIVGMAVALLVLTACDIEEVIQTAANTQVRATEIRTVSFTPGGAPTFDIDSSNGAIRVTGVDGQVDVQVTAELTSRGETLEEANERVGRIIAHMEQDGDLIRLQYRASEQDEDVRKYSGVSFSVTAPPVLADLSADSSNGSIIVHNVEGVLELDTSNGMIGVEDFRGELIADTSNGSIDVARAEGVLRLDTSNGSIDIVDVVASVDADTSNGRIEFAGVLAGEAHRFTTSNGSIRFRVPADSSLAIEAHTSNASISTNLPLIGHVSGTTWDAELNPPASVRVELRTSNASIRIEGL
ncbi:DUF4097 domain-containing protein [Candidatus Bipolaricaulota bacterium]